MALEAVVYPQLDPFGYALDYKHRDFYFLPEGGGIQDFSFLGNLGENYNNKEILQDVEKNNNNNLDTSSSSPSLMMQEYPNYYKDYHPFDPNSSPDHQACSLFSSNSMETQPPPVVSAATAAGGRRKRRRTISSKNKEEIENQRMTHIAVERNRRKQMNEYLAVLRSLMPPSYVQRGDQASIIGGSINFVKELEQLLQSMKVQNNHINGAAAVDSSSSSSSSSSPFAYFFSFPQYSSSRPSSNLINSVPLPNNNIDINNNKKNTNEDLGDYEGSQKGSVADIEVTMVENHANIKILTKKRARQLLKVVAMLQNLKLSILHLNVTTALNQMVLYSLSVKVEEGCHLNTVDEIAAAVNQILTKIQEESCCL